MSNRATPEYNLKKLFPELAKEWDYKKNELKPEDVTPGSGKKAWWICKNNHSYQGIIQPRCKRGVSCPYCSGQRVGYGNDFKTQFPKLAKEWDYKKNELKPEDVTPFSGINIWWICKNNHSYDAVLSKRTSKTKYKRGCPYCSGQRVGYGNDFKTQFPKLAKEWDYKKNELKPEDVHPGSHKKYHWICKDNHSYVSSIGSRTDQRPSKGNAGCPYCAGKKVGYGNDLKSIRPDLAKEWDYKKNKQKPTEVRPQTNKKYWWVCLNNHSYTSSVAHRFNGTGCPFCKLNSKSREEIYLAYELKNFFDFSMNDNKIVLDKILEVDIKIKNPKLIIEYDGAYWHKNLEDRDKLKTKKLRKAGWTVIRVREKPLNILSRKYNIHSSPGQYKETSNKVLLKINDLGFKVNKIKSYLNQDTLINKKLADKYIQRLLQKN